METGKDRVRRALGGEMGINVERACTLEGARVTWPFKSYQTLMSERTGLKIIAEIVKELGDGPVLLPAYLCSSMIQPFKEANIPIDFFHINEDLSIDIDHLNTLIEQANPNVLVFVNYFGFPVSNREKLALNEVKGRCWVIEDCAQGSLIESDIPVVGNIGHFALTSFRKYLPVPDGGLLVNNSSIPLPRLQFESSDLVNGTLLAKFLRYEYFRIGEEDPNIEETYLKLFSESARQLDNYIPINAMSAVAEKLLSDINLSEAMKIRRNNFSVLLEAFADMPELRQIGRPLITDLPEGVSPLAFPIRVPSRYRDNLRENLIKLRVFCPVHWPSPLELEPRYFNKENELSKQMLGLPIDQRYCRTDMGTLIDRILEAWEDIS